MRLQHHLPHPPLLALLRACSRLLSWALLVGLGLMAATPALAHEATMVDLRIQEVAPGDFMWSWGVGSRGRPVAEELSITWPEHCEVRGQAARCGSTGLDGQLEVGGVGKTYSAVIMRLYWYRGATQMFTLTDAMPRVRLFSGGEDQRGRSEIAKTYGILGVEHILTGWDHLLFVISLLILVGFNRSLVLTITAFTVAHSLTLAASALGVLTLRSAPVEATIAMSIVLVCGEALRSRNTLARRLPALVAFIFGLVHGLGFAGALKEIGLPADHAWVALLTFNIGVEAGQLMVVLACWLLMACRKRLGIPAGRWERIPVYAIGAVGTYWMLERMAGIIIG